MEPLLRRAAGIAAALTLAASLWMLQGDSLHSIYFATGWLLLFAIALDLGWRWYQSAKLPQARWIGVHAGLGIGAAALFFLHLDFRMPTGWIERGLVVLFAAMLLSGFVGLMIRLAFHFRLINPSAHAARLAQRWVMIHVPIEASLLALAIVHGVLVHSHGFMAHVMPGR